MQSDFLASLRRLSDDELVTRVKDLVCSERVGMVEVVAHLAELDTRDVHFRAGHGSLFAYCRDVLGLSEQEAYNRITVARAARRYPVVLQMLEDGSLNLTAARLLVPHLTPDNHVGVLEKARWKTKAQVEELAAALWPRPDVPSFVRKLHRRGRPWIRTLPCHPPTSPLRPCRWLRLPTPVTRFRKRARRHRWSPSRPTPTRGLMARTTRPSILTRRGRRHSVPPR